MRKFYVVSMEYACCCCRMQYSLSLIHILLQSEKKKTHTAQAMIEECRDKQRQAEQERDYAPVSYTHLDVYKRQH